MTLSAWWLLALIFPVLAIGQAATKHIRLLRKLDLPPVIVGGLLAAAVLLILNLSGIAVKFDTKVASRAWTWLITPETQLAANTPQAIYLPFSTMFFACVGLLAGWKVAKNGSWQILLLLLLATILGAVQNWVGVAIAKATGAPAALGIACGSLTLTGGPSTALGRINEFEKAGLHGVAAIATASAMFGIVCASLLASTVGGQIVRQFRLRVISNAGSLDAVTPDAASEVADSSTNASPPHGLEYQPVPPRVAPAPTSLFGNLAALRDTGANVALHVLMILACVKAGAWLGLGWQVVLAHFNHSMPLPVYMGALVTAIILRNAFDFAGVKLINPRTVDALAGIVLRIFLAMAIASLNLLDLKHVAGPMAVILPVQVLVTILFCVLITWPVMGWDYDAAVMATGHVGFGLGITPNAVASMDALIDTYGPAPRALLVATIVGGFLIDVTNTFLITLQLPHAN